MSTGDPRPESEPPVPALFAVRLWREELGGGCPASSWEYRGTVQDVRTRAFRAFRQWPELVAFLVAGAEGDERAGQARTEGDS